ncbi:hypothetical protein ABZ897_26860 [Nonomuraea sp. NPDC046802]|uniref:TRADD-N-associated membrane domain-containing protein n=1 Tax=Nonomuraea sp. NPDC046802 TaxID=3154919 RepID=UPI0033FCF773
MEILGRCIRWIKETVLPVIVALAIVVLALSLADLALSGGENVRVARFLTYSSVALIVIAAVVAARRAQEKARRREKALQELREAESAMRGADHLELAKLWTTTQSRLNYYHELATAHAQQSFRNAQIAAFIGFGLLLVFALIAMKVGDPQAALVASALGAISAALAGYVGRTFIRSQENAAGHLRTYFDQPVKFSRYLAAERLIAEMMALQPEQRAAISGELLRTIIAPDSIPSAAASAPSEPDGRGQRFQTG